MTVDVRCRMCATTESVEVPDLGYLAWRSGELIQEAMPDVPVGVRDQLVTSLCEDCQDDIHQPLDGSDA